MNATQSNKRFLTVTAAAGLFATAAWLAIGNAEVPAPAVMTAAEATPVATAPLAALEAPSERQPTELASAAGFYHAPPGQVMRFDYRTDSAVELRRRDDATGSTMKVQLAGAMQVAVLARRGDEFVAEVCFPETTGTIAGDGGGNSITGDDAIAQDFARPLLVRMRNDGSTLGFAFAAELHQEHRNWLRGLWSASRFVAKAEATYTTVEDDVVGAAALEYRWRKPFVTGERITGGRLARAKVSYGGDGERELGGITVEGQGEAHLNPDLGWFEQADWQETVVQEIDEIATVVTSRLTASWQLRDIDWRTVTGDDAVWQQDWQAASGQADAVTDGSELRYEERRLADVSLEQLLGDLAAMLQAEGDPHDIYGVKFDLTQLLRVRPEALARLEAMLRQLDDGTAMLAISAMAATELPEAQGIVAGLFADPEQSLANRQAAAFAMVQVTRPVAATVDTFATAVQAATVHEEGSAEGVLALGTLVGRASGEAQGRGLAALLGLEATAAQSGALPNWIEAVGNTGMPAALDVAVRYRDHGDIIVRAATASAVRLIPGPEAFAFAVAALQDEAALVRVRAIETLVGRSEPQVFAVLDTLLQNETDANVRAAVVRLLATRLPEAAAAALLQAVAAGDASAEVRQLALQQLQGS